MPGCNSKLDEQRSEPKGWSETKTEMHDDVGLRLR